VLGWRKTAPLAATLVPLARDLAALHAGLAQRARDAIARSAKADATPG
jgi:hypothetical protein